MIHSAFGWVAIIALLVGAAMVAHGLSDVDPSQHEKSIVRGLGICVSSMFFFVFWFATL